MSDFNADESWLQNNDTSNISINIKKHIKHGRHRTKYNFIRDPTDVIDQNVHMYDGHDHIKSLLAYIEEINVGNVEFSVFQCKSKSKIPAYYANIKIGNASVASSFPEKYSLPEVAKQVAARNALVVLKKSHSSFKNIPTTQDMTVVAGRLEKELQKNYAGLFCDKVEDVYKEVYNERLPSNWLIQLSHLTTNIIIEDLPQLNKSILYYASHADKEKHDEVMDLEEINGNLPLMKFVDKTERSVNVASIDSNHLFWILFIHDTINDDYDTLFQLMNMPDETKHFVKMLNIEPFDVYAVQIDCNDWYRYQVIKIEGDNVTGILIDLGMEWCVSKSDVMFLPPKFMKVPSQAIKCALTSLFFAPYFDVSRELLTEILIGKEFTVVPDCVEGDVPLVTLYNGNCNMNTVIMKAIVEKTKFNQIDKTCKRANLSYVADGYIYLHPPNETLLIMESILDSISASRPLEQLYSMKSISPHKVYLVKCTDLQIWSRAKIDDFTFDDEKFKVYFIDYGNYGFIDRDKFVDLQSIDPLLAVIGPQVLKVSFHLFPPEKLTGGLSKALYEMIVDKSLNVEVISTNSDGIQDVELYDADDEAGNCASFNIQLYQSMDI